MDRQYFVYIMTNKHNNILYTGITNDLKRRVYEHKEKLVGEFTNKYNITKLICRVGGGRASSPFSVRLVKLVHYVPNFPSTARNPCAIFGRIMSTLPGHAGLDFGRTHMKCLPGNGGERAATKSDV
jgi:hypothetical protein